MTTAPTRRARKVRLTQIDGALPNIALMKLAHWHRSQGDDVVLTTSVTRDMLEPAYDVVYGSAIFQFSAPLIDQFRREFPEAIVSGTGVADDGGITVEEVIGVDSWGYEHLDYGIYPGFGESIGFLSRGCRLKCDFCCVWRKRNERKMVSVAAVADVWRGGPRRLHLLDNDFFGNPAWRERIAEIREGRFLVSISQGINLRALTEEQAAAMASLVLIETTKRGKERRTILYRDTSFRKPRIYTAWDRLEDERTFFRGVERLAAAGIPPDHLMAYMIVGDAEGETWDDVWYRFNRMVARGIWPFVMVKDLTRTDLQAFQRWSNTGLYRIRSWLEYRRKTKTKESVAAYLRSSPPPTIKRGAGRGKRQEQVSMNF